jgi:hypothetical protein
VRDMPYSWEALVENLCDPAHIPFAHHSLMNGADRLSAMDIDMRIIAEDASGFSAQKDPYPEGTGRYDVVFRPPCLMFYTIVADSTRGKGSYLGLGQYCVPTAPGRCRLLARFPFRLSFEPAMAIIRKTPRWITHLSQNAVMDSDVVFLCSQDEIVAREEEVLSKYFMPARCDAMVSAFRRWLGKHGGSGPAWLGVPAQRSHGSPTSWIRPQRVPRREGRDALLDRYRQHTDICVSCRRAHGNDARPPRCVALPLAPMLLPEHYCTWRCNRENIIAVACLAALLYKARDAALVVGVCLVAAAAAIGGGGADAALRKVLAAAGAVLICVPRALLRPLIARLECAPWPRKAWRTPTPATLLAGRAR